MLQSSRNAPTAATKPIDRFYGDRHGEAIGRALITSPHTCAGCLRQGIPVGHPTSN